MGMKATSEHTGALWAKTCNKGSHVAHRPCRVVVRATWRQHGAIGKGSQGSVTATKWATRAKHDRKSLKTMMGTQEEGHDSQEKNCRAHSGKIHRGRKAGPMVIAALQEE